MLDHDSEVGLTDLFAYVFKQLLPAGPVAEPMGHTGQHSIQPRLLKGCNRTLLNTLFQVQVVHLGEYGEKSIKHNEMKRPTRKNNNNEAYYEVKIAYISFPLFTDNLENKINDSINKNNTYTWDFCFNRMVYEMCDQVNTVHEFILLREALVQETEEMPVLLPWPACKLALPC